MTQNLTHPSLRCKASRFYREQNAQSQRCNQILPKSIPALSTPTHGGQDNAANLTKKLIENKKGQLVTSGHKTLGVKWLFKHSTSHQGSVSGNTDAAPKFPTFHIAKRFCLFSRHTENH